MHAAIKDLPPLDAIPSPGAYLTRRRLVAGLDQFQVARLTALLPWAIAPATAKAVAHLHVRIVAAETDVAHFNAPQAALVAQVFRFDVHVYLALVDLAAAGPDSGLPVPHICIGCGCTWNDACQGRLGPCAWSDADPRRCTYCAPARTTPRRPKLEVVR